MQDLEALGDDPFDLQRFEKAQDGTYATAQRYAIGSAAESRAYIATGSAMRGRWSY